MNEVKYLMFPVNRAITDYLVYLAGSGNGKSILFMLFLVGGLMGYGVRRMNPKVAHYVYWAALYLVILFLPLLLLSLWLTF
ncbi:MAG: hypothetical protein ICV83_17710 [Cytophagales bacterium]|nr:hypothetical protein [Cytophagales bacterium]